MESKSKKIEIVMLEGDGIGPEITEATSAVLRAVDQLLNLDIHLDKQDLDLPNLMYREAAVPGPVMDRIKSSDGIVLGPITTQDEVTPGAVTLGPSGELRARLELFANVRPARTRGGVPARCGMPIDLVIVRENTEGFYADRSMCQGYGEVMPTPDLAMAFRKITRHASMRISEAAFRLARRRRRKVTAVSKDKVLKYSDGLFMECARAVAVAYPDVEYEEKAVDTMAALLIRDSSKFDVVVTTNMFGDILSDEATEIAGSLGLGASINFGEAFGMAQAQHGSAPDIAGKDIANPSSLIGSAAMLLAWLGERRDSPALNRAADLIERSLDAILENPASRTRDLGGNVGTAAFTQSLIAKIETLAKELK